MQASIMDSAFNQYQRNDGPSRMRTAEQSPAGFLLIGFLTLVALVVVAERAGFPEIMAQKALIAVLVLFCLVTVFVAKTAEEAGFLGRLAAGKVVSSGIVLGVVLTGTGMALLRPDTAGGMAAILAGQVLGVLAAHAVARWQWQRTGSAATDQTSYNPFLAMLSGMLEAVAGAALCIACLSLMVGGLMPAITAAGMQMSSGWLALLLLLVAAFAVAAGGLRACLGLLLGLTSLVGVGYLIMLVAGLAGLGSLPLPGFSETSTLNAIAEAKLRWFQTSVHPVALVAWPSLSDVVSADNRIWFACSAALAFSLASLLAPAIPLRRRSIVVPALATGILLPLAMVATAGYAIEAAGFQFVGASVQRPPAGLLEASRNGFVTLCNAAPATADALRIACGVSPREVMSLGVDQISILPAFLTGGLPAALAYPAALVVLARVAEPLVVMSGFVAGFWIAARGLGLRVMARDKMAPGLTSLRLGLVRLAALLLTGGLIACTALFVLPAGLLWTVAATTAFAAVLLRLVFSRSAQANSERPDEAGPVVSSGRATARKPKKRADSAAGETA
ncbi:MAG: hypothetical protein ACRCWF_11000 [Beijerinckiaceae bacterium]